MVVLSLYFFFSLFFLVCVWQRMRVVFILTATPSFLYPAGPVECRVTCSLRNRLGHSYDVILY